MALVTVIKVLANFVCLFIVMLVAGKSLADVPHSKEESYFNLQKHVGQIRSAKSLDEFFKLIQSFQFGDRPIIFEGFSDLYEQKLNSFLPSKPKDAPIEYEVSLNFDDSIRRETRIFWYPSDQNRPDTVIDEFKISSFVKNRNFSEKSRSCAPDILTWRSNCLVHRSFSKDSYNLLEIKRLRDQSTAYANLSRSKISLLRTVSNLIFQDDRLFFERNRNYQDISQYSVNGLFHIDAISFQYRMEKQIRFTSLNELNERLRQIQFNCSGECKQNIKIYTQLRFATKSDPTIWYSSDRWLLESKNFF